jgi:23S rRNA pseudouridine955/2504/2580 synthase
MGVPDHDGMIELPLAKQPGTGGEKMMVDESEHGLPSRTRYRVIDRAGNRAAWVELQPFTGRTHQLRVHMAAIGHDRGRWQVWRPGRVPFGQHQPQAAPCPPPAHRASRRRPDRCDRPLPEHFAKSLEQLGFTESEATCRSKRRCWSIPRKRRSARPRPTPSNTARNAGANAASAPMAREPAAPQAHRAARQAGRQARLESRRAGKPGTQAGPKAGKPAGLPGRKPAPPAPCRARRPPRTLQPFRPQALAEREGPM